MPKPMNGILAPSAEGAKNSINEEDCLATLTTQDVKRNSVRGCWFSCLRRIPRPLSMRAIASRALRLDAEGIFGAMQRPGGNPSGSGRSQQRSGRLWTNCQVRSQEDFGLLQPAQPLRRTDALAWHLSSRAK